MSGQQVHRALAVNGQGQECILCKRRYHPKKEAPSGDSDYFQDTEDLVL